ncbi:MAG: bidirectional hydrogenase complex protein HoxU [Candidatus Omnitrophota bacterium]|nr:bidirectional hydrogenase complex protein HoxU [Candidatus Omnitrophota bacterium]MDZ4241411.1 bidirectional hydrogenase complex protein HoxU [Candidatus Omnitrophota bacterium]
MTVTAKIPIMLDDKPLEVEPHKTILEVCKEHGVELPVLCHFEGLTDVGACRLCLVEIEGVPRLLPACTTKVAPNQKIKTQTDRLKKYRRITMELFFAERNHVCAVCVANNKCELQDLGYKVGMEHVRFPYLFPSCNVDASHPKYVIDHNRCIMCTRCVRVCGEVEGAHNWNIMGRGFSSRIISDFNQPWGESVTCTSCGKCLNVCPTGALWDKNVSQGQMSKAPESIVDLVQKRRMNL